MKIKIQKEKLSSLFGISFINKLYSDALLRFTKKGLIINDGLIITGLAVAGVFKPEYFTSYEVTENENVIVPQSFANMIKQSGFKGAEAVLYTQDDELFIESGKDQYSEELQEIPNEADSIEQIRITKTFPSTPTEYGIVPKKDFEPHMVAKVKVDDLSFPDNAEYISLSNDGNKIIAQTKVVGKFKREITPVEFKQKSEEFFELKFEHDALRSMVKQFKGTTWLVPLQEHLVLTDRNSERLFMFLLGESNE